MKRLLAILLFAPLLALAGGNDLVMTQRNAGDTGQLTRIVAHPVGITDGIMGYNGSTQLPVYFAHGAGLSVTSGVVDAVPQDWSVITGKPTFAAVATTGAYADLSGKPTIPAAQVSSDWNSVTPPTQILNKPATFPPSAHNQAWSTITATPTTLAGYGITDAYPLAGNPSGFLTGITSGQVTTALGFTPYNATNPSAFINQAGARTAISLTTTGTAGAATYNSSTGVLNVPNYAPGTGTVTSVTAGTGLSGGVITTSGTISMPNTGTAGTYTNVTTDAQGRVTAGLTASINDSPGRALVTTTASTGFQISASRVSHVCYEGSISTTSTIGGPSAASVFLETADTNSTTPGDWTTKASQTYSNNITLAIVLNQVQGNNWSMCRYIPAGKFVRIRSGSVTGTASVTINAQQQEVLL